MLKRQKWVFINYLQENLIKKTKKKRLENFHAGDVGSFYSNLANSVDNFLGSDFYGRIANDYGIPSDDVQKYILATSEMQTDINHYVTQEELIMPALGKSLTQLRKLI